MRRILLATLALIAALALVAVPLVAARGHADDNATTAKTTAARHHENETGDNETDDDNDTTESHTHPARRDAASDRANRTADRVAIRTFVGDWHDNATAIRDACKTAAANDMTGQAHCVQDGYRSWWTAHVDDLKTLFRMLRLDRHHQ
jgi:hypothetical protein